MTMSPKWKARAIGFLYLLMMLCGGLATFAKKTIFVSNDAAATATNILTHVYLFQSWFAAELLVVAIYVVVTVLFFDLFRPVNRSIASLAALFSIIGCAIQAFASFFRIAPLTVLSGAPQLSVFTRQQLQALAYTSFKLYGQAYGIGLVFFAFQFVVIGYLVYKSTFLPRTLGVLAVISGVAWLTFLSPLLASQLFPRVLMPLDIGEMLLVLWLLVMGVNVPRWEEQAAKSR